MDTSQAQFWFNVIQFLFQIALWLFVWISNRNRVSREKMDAIESTLNKRDEQLAVEMGRIDERLKKAIGHPELEPIHRRINNVDKQMSEMMGEFKGVRHLVELIHENMMRDSNGGKS